MGEKPLEESIEIKLIDDVSKTEISGIGSNIAELGIDSILHDGFLKDVDGLGFIVSIYKISKSIRERLFLKKVLIFFQKLSEC